MDKDKIPVPSELTNQYKWDWAVSEFGKKVFAGGAASGLASFVLFGRGNILRVVVSSLGAGFGGGWAYKTVSDEFGKDKSP